MCQTRMTGRLSAFLGCRVRERGSSAIHANLHGGPNIVTCSQCMCPLHVHTMMASRPPRVPPALGLPQRRVYWKPPTDSGSGLWPAYPPPAEEGNVPPVLKKKILGSQPALLRTFLCLYLGIFFSPPVGRVPQNTVR